jgi:hypothetical protein
MRSCQFCFGMSQFCDTMDLWTFKGFVDDNGLNVFDEWYKELPPAAQTKVDWLVEMFKVRKFADWRAKYIKILEDDIYEVRFEINRICYRPLGAFAPNQKDFTFLIGVIKKNKIPESTMDVAAKRLDIIRNNPERAKKCELE